MTEHDRREVRKQRAIMRKKNKKVPTKLNEHVSTSVGESSPATISLFLHANLPVASTIGSAGKLISSGSGNKAKAITSAPEARPSQAVTRKRSGLRQRNFTVTYFADKAPKFVPHRVSKSGKVERIPLLPGQEGM